MSAERRRIASILLAVLLAVPGISRADIGDKDRRRDDELRERIFIYWQDEAWAPPERGMTSPSAKIPPEQNRLFARELARRVDAQSSTPFDLIDYTKGDLSMPPWWRIAEGPELYGNVWPALEEVGQPWWPEALDLVARKVAWFSLSRHPASKDYSPFYTGRRPSVWNDGTAEHLVLPGPAVKDGVATYRAEEGRTRIRIPLSGEEPAAHLYRWARDHGLPMKVALRREPLAIMVENGPELNRGQALTPFPPIDAETELPAWIVLPGGLLPARVVAFSAVGVSEAEGACRGSNWLELVIAGDTQPPVWAVLLSSPTDPAKDAKIRRLAAKTPGEDSYREGQRGEIEVRWPDSLPALRLVARRFDYVEQIYDEATEGSQEPLQRLLGSAWGVQVFPADAAPVQPNSYDRPRPITASGSPRCAPP